MRFGFRYALMGGLLASFLAAPLAHATQGKADLGDDLALGENVTERMTVPVMINGQGPFPFVIDTGAERSMISSELAAELGLGARGTGLIHTISGIYPVDMVSIERLSISGDGARQFDVPAVPRAALGAVGLLGLDSLQSSKVLFDLRKEVMSIRPSVLAPSRRRAAKSDHDTIVVTAKRAHGRLIFTDARLNGTAVRVVVDTGAEVTVGNTALRTALRRNATDGTLVSLIDVVGEELEANFNQLRSLKIGGMTLKGGGIAYSDAPIFAQLGLDDEPAILLGMDTIRAFRQVAIDFPNRQVSFHLKPDGVGANPLASDCLASRIARRGC
ncbi:aspartyl protease family protein [Pacificimonas sp. WHA3]|uniref:Aspartyl protease family protein n=1 Tax=Pacificimonas pallii TaxID=2827236 RepID=A0ABS6SGC2_9SPHN|nr:aspartyl protease family protein [Pacificimonas pallii]MBV7257459.1 aspartyl protease family protein [Pacificimonas pallii]